MPYQFYPQNNYQNIYPQNNYQNFSQMIPGRMVANANEITASEVPMDGNVAVFPSKNLEEVYIKQWAPNGSIITHVYSRTQPLSGDTDTNTRVEEIRAKMGLLETKLNDLEARISKRKEMKE